MRSCRLHFRMFTEMLRPWDFVRTFLVDYQSDFTFLFSSVSATSRFSTSDFATSRGVYARLESMILLHGHISILESEILRPRSKMSSLCDPWRPLWIVLSLGEMSILKNVPCDMSAASVVENTPSNKISTIVRNRIEKSSCVRFILESLFIISWSLFIPFISMLLPPRQIISDTIPRIITQSTTEMAWRVVVQVGSLDRVSSIVQRETIQVWSQLDPVPTLRKESWCLIGVWMILETLRWLTINTELWELWSWRFCGFLEGTWVWRFFRTLMFSWRGTKLWLIGRAWVNTLFGFFRPSLVLTVSLREIGHIYRNSGGRSESENRGNLNKHLLMYSAAYMTVYGDGEKKQERVWKSLLQVRPLSERFQIFNVEWMSVLVVCELFSGCWFNILWAILGVFTDRKSGVDLVCVTVTGVFPACWLGGAVRRAGSALKFFVQQRVSSELLAGRISARNRGEYFLKKAENNVVVTQRDKVLSNGLRWTTVVLISSRRERPLGILNRTRVTLPIFLLTSCFHSSERRFWKNRPYKERKWQKDFSEEREIRQYIWSVKQVMNTNS